MTSMELLELLGGIHSDYIEEAHRKPTARFRRKPLLIAAVMALLAILTACAAYVMHNWNEDFFTRQSDEPLRPEQIQYVEEQSQRPGDVQTHDGYTIQLLSTMSDEKKGLAVFQITAPQGTDLEALGIEPAQDFKVREISGKPPTRVSSYTQEDSDGQTNTLNFYVEIIPMEDTAQPGAADSVQKVSWKITFSSLLSRIHDDAYEQELLNTKYKGQDGVMFTEEEYALLNKETVLAEGPWAFTADFSQGDTQSIELITAPIEIETKLVQYNPKADTADLQIPEPGKVKITSLILRPLTASITWDQSVLKEGFDGYLEMGYWQENDFIYAVMKDGSRIVLANNGGGSRGSILLEAFSPVILSEVDHILFPDGTQVPMP